MTLIQTTPPALEPISLAEAKAHLRLDTSVDDLLVAALITAARQHIETTLRIKLVSQSLTLFLDSWPDLFTPITLPVGPVIALLAVRTFAPDSTPTSHPLTSFELDRSTRARVALRAGATLSGPLRKMDGVEIAFSAGFGTQPSDVPRSLRQALLHLLTHFYEHRGQTPDSPLASVEPLLAPWRTPRLL